MYYTFNTFNPILNGLFYGTAMNRKGVGKNYPHSASLPSPGYFLIKKG